MKALRKRKSIRARAPKASSEKARYVMLRNVGHDTRPERLLRSALFKAGLRFRKDYKPVPELRLTVDIAFVKRKLCVFIDGCFWHGCPFHFSVPKSNSSWWKEKIEDNRLRDQNQTRKLQQHGWSVLRFWEHEVNEENLPKICSKIGAVLNSPKKP